MKDGDLLEDLNKKHNKCKVSSFLIMSNWEKYLKDIYLDPSHPASFGSPDHLYKIVKNEGKHKISHSQIKKWIQKKESYSLNKGIKRKFQRS